jgi:transposase-like protein
MPGRKWTGEEKANIVLEILTTSTPTAEICRRYNVFLIFILTIS